MINFGQWDITLGPSGGITIALNSRLIGGFAQRGTTSLKMVGQDEVMWWVKCLVWCM